LTEEKKNKTKGMLNIFVVLPQICVSVVIGSLVIKFFADGIIIAMAIGGVSAFICRI